MITITEKTRNTPKLRLRIYRAALEYLPTDKYMRGLCYAISESIDDIGNMSPYFRMKTAYPELYKYKPDGAEQYWFDYDLAGRKKRISILKKAIAELEAKTKKP